jgi:hypothetical protein
MKHCLYFLLFFNSLGVFAQTLEDDRLALLAFYNATNGNSWGIHSGWESPGTVGSSPCGWSGITCNNGRVTEINLFGYHLGGYMPAEIGNLSALTKLELRRINSGSYGIEGPIPASLWGLTNLEYLSLSGNNFQGGLPSAIGNLTKLKYLNLAHNFYSSLSPSVGALTGTIPKEIGNLTDLTYLNLYRQNFTGNLPAELSSLTKLETLILSDNNLSGSIPPGLGSLINLKTLDLSYYVYMYSDMRSPKGGLTGSIPVSFVNLSALQYLSLSGQSLSGGVANLSTIPANAMVSISENNFTFTGIEGNVNRIDYYSPQAKIPMKGMFPLSSSVGVDGTIYVEAGGTISNNIYKWFKDNNLVATNVGVNTFNTTGLGTYQVQVTNSFAPDLTLVSEDYPVTILPVTLISFSGKNDADENHLTWKTTSETNNSGFEIERSADAKSFERIGFVDGNGDSKVVKNYNFTDSNPSSTTYYRLKQIDYDGQFEYSRIIAVKRNFSGISIYPNPARDQIFVRDLEKEAQIIVRNAEGKTLLTQMVYPKQAVELNNFSNGFYFITIGNEVRKVVIDR